MQQRKVQFLLWGLLFSHQTLASEKRTNLRNGKLDDQEKQAFRDIQKKERIQDDMLEAIIDNLETLGIKAEMLGEEIDSQRYIVDEASQHAETRTDRLKKTNTRLRKLNGKEISNRRGCKCDIL